MPHPLMAGARQAPSTDGRSKTTNITRGRKVNPPFVDKTNEKMGPQGISNQTPCRYGNPNAILTLHTNRDAVPQLQNLQLFGAQPIQIPTLSPSSHLVIDNNSEAINNGLQIVDLIEHAPPNIEAVSPFYGTLDPAMLNDLSIDFQ
ncbi:hypothetical protein QAD02_021663 [Eretmocerus hayati]|uniref:Uncharacterized protein n=1 Tax=Eretmocerus hayati TaxID=131215 RepID=A0ACC2PQI9_9HYME|nr:hypothetical protein QAD02_021663 [Eretmocerus hayati]